MQDFKRMAAPRLDEEKSTAEQRNELCDAIHFILPDIREGESATQFRARCQVELGDALFRSVILRRIAAVS